MTAAQHVAFRVGTAEYVVPSDQVLHLDAFESATPIPGSQVFVAGLVQVRGKLVPVVDLRVRFGLPAATAEGQLGRRVIVVQCGTRVAGLLVDSARDIVAIAPGAFVPPPELVDQQASGFVKAVATLGKRLVLLIDVPRVLGEELSHGTH